jgi:tRNA (cytidine32/uridine32-2'-O)-methyltransferase
MSDRNYLMSSNIRIVLVNTSHAGNIGAVARAMKNMGLVSLYLVEPREYPSAEATARASGADDILASAVVVDTLEEALSGCTLVCGASARLRRISWPQLNPAECAEKLASEAEMSHVAIVFGRERTGLTNEELAHCNYLVHIPCNPEFPALNIAAAVQIIAYEIYQKLMSKKQLSGKTEASSIATADEMERFYNHLAETLVDIEFLDPENPRQLMHRLRRLFNRAQLDEMELNILRGILTSSQKLVKHRE